MPWLTIRPQLGPANPPLASACGASQLRAKLGLEGLGFGTLGGPLMVENRGSSPCALVGMPKISFAGATSKWSLRRGSAPPTVRDPLTPPQTSLRALAPGRWAATYLTWSNWCGRGSSRYRSDPGQPPRAMVLSAPGGGRISVMSNLLHHQQTTPICGGSGPSALGASHFLPIVPQGPPSSALPLKASIVPSAHIPLPGLPNHKYPVLTAERGRWLSYTVVLVNRAARPFSFGRSCPAYIESLIGHGQEAYILNCRAVGVIAAHASVRFAMRIPIPSRLRPGDGYTVLWNLAPHSWNAPSGQIHLQLR